MKVTRKAVKVLMGASVVVLLGGCNATTVKLNEIADKVSKSISGIDRTSEKQVEAARRSYLDDRERERLEEIERKKELKKQQKEADRLAYEQLKREREKAQKAYIDKYGPATSSEIKEFKNDFIVLCISNGKMSPSACRCVTKNVSEKGYPNSVLQSIARGAPTKEPFEDVSLSLISLAFSCSM